MTDEISDSGKDINFEAPKTEELEEQEALALKEKINQLVQAINSAMLKFGVDDNFVDGRSDDEYRELSKQMQQLAPTTKKSWEQKTKTPFQIMWPNGSGGSFLELMTRSRDTIENAIDRGFNGGNIDGMNFSVNTVMDKGRRFFLTEEESKNVDFIENDFLEAHDFALLAAEKLFVKFCSSELTQEELAYIPRVNYQKAVGRKDFYPKLPESIASKLDSVVEKVTAIFKQNQPEIGVMNSALNRFIFIIATVSLARLKRFEEIIVENGDLLPSRIQELRGTDDGEIRSYKQYDVSNFHLSQEDAQVAQERYLSWLKLNDNPISAPETQQPTV